MQWIFRWVFHLLGETGGIFVTMSRGTALVRNREPFTFAFAGRTANKASGASAAGISSAITSWLNWGARASWSGICGYWLRGHSHSAGSKSDFSVWIGIHGMILDGVENPGILRRRLFPYGFAPLADASSWQYLVLGALQIQLYGSAPAIANFGDEDPFAILVLTNTYAARLRCRSAHVIVNVAGPYMLTQGELLLDCCCRCGTDYCDVSGEIPWWPGDTMPETVGFLFRVVQHGKWSAVFQRSIECKYSMT